MNKGTFAKRLVLPVMAGVLVLSAGCTTEKSSAPVRDSRPIPTARTAPSPPPPTIASPVAQPGEHVVRRGETLYAVSRLYGVPVPDLIAWNNLSRPEQLEVGQILRVAAPQALAEPLAPPPPPDVAVSPPEVKREPRGGKQAWSEDAWARLQPQAVDSVPPATISRPEFSATEHSTPKPGVSESWMWPVKGTIISRFDEAVGEDSKLRNKGIDIAGTPGTPILAALGGEVIYARDVREYGNLVIIRHNDEYLTAYAHNRVILVKEGDAVAKGQKIAELGNSDTDRPKLHFELRKQGIPVDPLRYLPGL
ncbi:MAG: peptidoglycan DD-metalloendopeptidase family protein [Proteobacteria bacterium]|nr:peptidoglycan DD-metalloendopeptidase family protein [Pseudomonadota bacterium]